VDIARRHAAGLAFSAAMQLAALAAVMSYFGNDVCGLICSEEHL
jgi:undecaprenyl pyrophosphate phosphatase UppP